MIKNLFLVGLGGGIGSMMRYLTWYVTRSPQFPIPTFIVNITGSLLIGMVIGFGEKDSLVSANWKLFLATGICGGFTTFSALSMENLQLIQAGKYFTSFAYICGSIILGITASWIGFKIVVS